MTKIDRPSDRQSWEMSSHHPCGASCLRCSPWALYVVSMTKRPNICKDTCAHHLFSWIHEKCSVRERTRDARVQSQGQRQMRCYQARCCLRHAKNRSRRFQFVTPRICQIFQSRRVSFDGLHWSFECNARCSTVKVLIALCHGTVFRTMLQTSAP